MTPPPPGWGASTAAGAVIARLAALYARALRVDAEAKRQRMERLANLISKRDTP